MTLANEGTIATLMRWRVFFPRQTEQYKTVLHQWWSKVPGPTRDRAAHPSVEHEKRPPAAGNEKKIEPTVRRTTTGESVEAGP